MTPKPASSPVTLPPSLIYLAFIIVGLGLGRLVQEPSLALGGPQRAIALVLVIIGLVIDGWASGHQRRYKNADILLTTGAYARSRNPVYLGYAMIYFGFGIAMDSPVTLALALPCLFIIHKFVIPREEAELSARFGSVYDDYRNKVRRWL